MPICRSRNTESRYSGARHLNDGLDGGSTGASASNHIALIYMWLHAVCSFLRVWMINCRLLPDTKSHFVMISVVSVSFNYSYVCMTKKRWALPNYPGRRARTKSFSLQLHVVPCSTDPAGVGTNVQALLTAEPWLPLNPSRTLRHCSIGFVRSPTL